MHQAPRSATRGPSPCILDSGHNISPRLQKQLVLELEVEVVSTKVVEDLPRRVIFRKVIPLDQNAPDPAALLGAQGTLRSRQHPTVVYWRKIAWSWWRVAAMLLQEANMEDVVDASALRQLETVGDSTDAFEDAERPGPTGPQLALGARVEGLRGAVEKAQPDPRAHLELHVPVVGVVVLLGQLLSLKEPLTNLGKHLVTAAEESIGGLRAGRPRPVGQNGRWRAAVDDLEGCSAEGGMEGSIIAILRP